MKKFLTIMLAIIMIAMMFVMVGCGKTTDNNNENGSTNNGGSNITTDKNNNNKTEELVDKLYTPDTENLVGIAVYRVKEGEEYPYVEGQKITDFSNWKYFYIDGEIGTEESTKVVFDDNVIEREIRYDDVLVVGCMYKTKDLSFWGYIYNKNDSLYLIATEDIAIDPKNNKVQEVSNWSILGAGIGLDCRAITDEEPLNYRYVFQVDDGKDDRGRYKYKTIYNSEIYTIDTLPTEITFNKEPWVNFVAIERIANGEIVGTTKIAYYGEVPYVGKPGTVVMLSLYKNGESYQHVVTVNQEK